MDVKKLVIVIIILILVWVVGSALLSGDKSNNTPTTGTSTPESIVADHTFAGGIHTLTGTIALPTPCHELSHEVVVAESFPEQVAINFTTESADEFCAQVITDAPFEVTVEASENATFDATFNGESASLELVETGNTRAMEDTTDEGAMMDATTTDETDTATTTQG